MFFISHYDAGYGSDVNKIRLRHGQRICDTPAAAKLVVYYDAASDVAAADMDIGLVRKHRLLGIHTPLATFTAPHDETFGELLDAVTPRWVHLSTSTFRALARRRSFWAQLQGLEVVSKARQPDLDAFTCDFFTYLAPYLISLSCLQLRFLCDPLLATMLGAVASTLPALQHLALSLEVDIPAPVFDRIRPGNVITRLQTLHIGFTGTSAATAVRLVTAATSLQHLWFEFTEPTGALPVSTALAHALSKKPLTRLALRCNNAGTFLTEWVRAGGTPSLAILNLSFENVGARDEWPIFFESLPTLLPALEILHLSGSLCDVDNTVRCLRALPALRCLRFVKLPMLRPRTTENTDTVHALLRTVIGKHPELGRIFATRSPYQALCSRLPCVPLVRRTGRPVLACDRLPFFRVLCAAPGRVLAACTMSADYTSDGAMPAHELGAWVLLRDWGRSQEKGRHTVAPSSVV